MDITALGSLMPRGEFCAWASERTDFPLMLAISHTWAPGYQCGLYCFLFCCLDISVSRLAR